MIQKLSYFLSFSVMIALFYMSKAKIANFWILILLTKGILRPVSTYASRPLMYKGNSVRPRPGTSIILTKAIANLFRGNQSSNLRCRRSQTFYIMHGLHECVGRLQRRLPMQLFSLKILNVFHKALLQGFQK